MIWFLYSIIIPLFFISCEENLAISEDVYGCTISTACNFNSNANIYDGSCWYADLGCECADGSQCGCTDPDACNYDINATNDSGLCWSTEDTGCPCGYGLEVETINCITGEDCYEECWDEYGDCQEWYYYEWCETICDYGWETVCEDFCDLVYEDICVTEAFDDINGDGIWNDEESYQDLNGNGIYDENEPFEDLNENGIWDSAEPLTECPEY